MKKALSSIFSMIMALTIMATLASCGSTGGTEGGGGTDFDPNNVSFAAAYEKAQELGFTGTLEEFIVMISGKDGAPGADGKPGADGIGIEKIEFDENGDLLVTFTDGRTETVAMPEKEVHTHTFDKWINYFANNNVDCEERLFYRICKECSVLEWKSGSYDNHTFETVTTPPTCVSGGYDTKTCTTCGKVEITNETDIVDHTWCTEYDDSFHRFYCEICDATKDRAEHSIDESGFCTSCNAPLVPTKGIVYEVSTDGAYAEVKAYNGTATRIIIASEYNGLPVRTIYNSAFKSSNITSVIIPDSVTIIGSSAFLNCTSLTSVTIGNGVTSIGSHAFSGCRSLTSVTIGNSVTSIGNSAFYDCISLTSVYITDIAAWCKIAFSGYYSNPLYYANNLYLNGTLVTDLVIPDSVTSIGSSAFSSCTSLQSVTIPDSVTSIGEGAFSGCSGLTSVTIGDGVTSIGDDAFRRCTSLTSVTIGNSVTSIGEGAFSDCNSALYTEYEYGKYIGDSENPYSVLIAITNKKLSTYTINEKTKAIVPKVFSDCARLTNITIPNGVKSISEETFRGCSCLTSVTIPDSVTSIGFRAFEDCTSLTIVTIPDSVTSIEGYAFEDCTSLTSVTIPDSVTSIEGYAFEGCYKLVEVINKSSLNIVAGSPNNGYVGYHAKEVHNGESKIVNKNNYLFYTYGGIDYLLGYSGTDTAITLPENYEGKNYQICNYAFYQCTSLMSVIIPDSVTSIGKDAFSGCSSLQIITLPFVGGSKDATRASASTLFGYIFGTDYYTGSARTEQYYSSSSSVTYYIPSSLRNVTITGGNLLYGAFYNCSRLTSVTIGDGVTSIGKGAFSGCSNLESITLPFVGGSKDATSASESTLLGYIFGTSSYTGSAQTKQYYSSQSSATYYIPSSLKNVTITGGNLLYGAFYNCKSLTSVTIGDGVTSIGEGAFSGCSYLKSITLPFVGGSKDAASASASTLFGYIFGTSSYTGSAQTKQYVGSSSSVTYYIPSSLKNVTITGGNILYGAFYNCDSLTSVTVGNGVTSIGEGAFSSCNSLTSVTIGNGVTSIGDGAFSFCISLQSVTIPDSVTSIGEFAFSFCISLYSVTIPDSVTSIGSYAFYNCSILMSITIPDSVTSIGSYAFYNCSSLMSITIPDSVTSIGEEAFYGCRSLTIIKYRGTESQWKAISKGSWWNISTGKYTITYNYCDE